MRFLALLAAVVIGIVPASRATADDAAIIAGVTAARAALGEAFQKHDEAAITAIYTPDHVSVSSFYGPPLTVKEQLAAFSELKETIVSSTPVDIVPIGPRSALVNFENAFKGTFKGKPLPSRVYVSEIWLIQDGAWRQRLYQETPIAP